MWIPKNPPGGWPVKALVAVGSLVFVHIVVIVGHTVLDETSPDSVFYPLDRGVEIVEVLWSRLWGKDAQSEMRLHIAMERIEEVEALLEHDILDEVLVSRLYEDALYNIQLALIPAEHTEAYAEDIEHFAHAVFIQSTLEDVMLRVSNASAIMAEGQPAITAVMEGFLVAMEKHLEVSNNTVIAFNVSTEVEAAVRREVSGKLFGSVTPSEEAACVPKGASCVSTADCCSDAGLTCMPFQSSAGFTKRCWKL